MTLFIIILKYKKPISEVERFLSGHKLFLEKYYSKGIFLASGRQNPRVGGVIICKSDGRAKVEGIIGQDHFFIHEIADYDIFEFEPTMYSVAFKGFVESELRQ